MINTFIDNVEDLDIFMPMYNLLECSDNYYMSSQSFWNYYRKEVNDVANRNNAVYNMINNNKTINNINQIFWIYDKNNRQNTRDNNTLNTKVVVLLKNWAILGDFLIYHWLTVKQNLICHGQNNI